MRKKLPLFLLVLGLILALALAGCTGKEPAKQEEPPAANGEAQEEKVDWGRFSIGSSSIGSASYTKTVAWANHMAEVVPYFFTHY